MRELITHSSSTQFKNCRRAYFYRYVQGLAPRVTKESLLLGSLVHLGLEKGKEAALSESQAVYASSQEEANDLETMRITVNAMLQGYEETLSPLNLIQTEIPFELTLKNPSTKRVSPKFALAGKVDGLTKRNGEYCLVEYKTASSIDKTYVDRLALDSQVTLYIYALQRFMGIRIDGVIYRVLRKPTIRQGKKETLYQYQDRLIKDYKDRPEWYFHEEFLYRSQADLLEFEKELWQVSQDIKDAEKTGRWYKNTSRCSDYKTMCQYAPLCQGMPGAELLYEHREPHEELRR